MLECIDFGEPLGQIASRVALTGADGAAVEGHELLHVAAQSGVVRGGNRSGHYRLAAMNAMSSRARVSGWSSETNV